MTLKNARYIYLKFVIMRLDITECVVLLIISVQCDRMLEVELP